MPTRRWCGLFVGAATPGLLKRTSAAQHRVSTGEGKPGLSAYVASGVSQRGYELASPRGSAGGLRIARAVAVRERPFSISSTVWRTGAKSYPGKSPFGGAPAIRSDISGTSTQEPPSRRYLSDSCRTLQRDTH